MSKMSKRKIGITGTIGSGKSSVTKIIKNTYPTLSADVIVSNMYKDKDFIKKVNLAILNKESQVLNKDLLAKTIFSNKEKKVKLESMIHPIVKEKIKKFQEKREGLTFVEVPLLYEAKFEDLFDFVIIVVADENKIVERLKKHRGYSEEEAKSRIQNQYSKEKKKEKADYIIENNLGIEDLEKEVLKLIKLLEKGE